MKHPQSLSRHYASYHEDNRHKPNTAKSIDTTVQADKTARTEPFSITELTDIFKVEMPMPGLKREEFFISADKNDLSVRLVYVDDKGEVKDSARVNPLSVNPAGQHILLPDNADTEFAYAEYNGDVLLMHVPKTRQPLRDFHTRIVVY